MSDIPKNKKKDILDVKFEREKLKEIIVDGEAQQEKIIKKDFVPHFFPTFRISRKFYPIPIIIVVICAGFLAYLTYVLAGVQIEGGYISEKEHGATAGILNGIIFTVMAAISSFIIIFLVKKRGLDILRYIFGISFGFLGLILTLFFGEIVLYLLFFNLPATNIIYASYYICYFSLIICTGVLNILMIYKYFASKSVFTKNIIVLYLGLLTGALLGIIMPLWTTLAVLIGISLWDIYAVKSKRGPIKEMIDLASQKESFNDLSKEEIKSKLKTGEIVYDTSKVEIGIGDLTFYSMLTSSALIITSNLIIMILTAIAIIFGTGITIQGLRRNKVLPGLPISIFLGISTMLLSWYLVSILI